MIKNCEYKDCYDQVKTKGVNIIKNPNHCKNEANIPTCYFLFLSSISRAINIYIARKLEPRQGSASGLGKNRVDLTRV